ncbi:tRNA (adenosine(37)-N6)-threonylcarbamoyltransferase complex transferase subunit TsaD [Candidatus Roizmanbacteria bacterium]|jgi:N6-L-threonylcarbamoyladenine synthase|nr:tRNA (adenosine(37)-N6)-threonylcarbamoyltransferase complex transferase subunit TsaD [Candidatus Roizmanbacteria bacterium]
MNILAIDTSCDETCAAITSGQQVMSNVIYSQILIHKKWGGVVPSLAKRAHEEKIDMVIEECLTKFGGSFSNIDAVAVTYGPGLAVALEVGIKKARSLAKKYKKQLIAVNHLEGHIYSPFVQNSKGNPKIKIEYPYLSLIVSGGHTELVVVKGHLKYEVVGETIDDAAGEALDKAAKLLGLGYPGGPVIEKLSEYAGHADRYRFPRPMIRSTGMNFSFSGLKTAFYYHLKKTTEDDKSKNINYLASSFQAAVFDSLLNKTEKAVKRTGIKRLLSGGGVIANLYLRKKLRELAEKIGGEILFPPYPYLTGDNAAMIGVVGFFKAKQNIFVKEVEKLDRIPRLTLG